jgi:hypothetical protein
MFIDVSEEYGASICAKREVAYSSETRVNIPEDSIHCHCHGNLQTSGLYEMHIEIPVIELFL